MAKHKSKAQSVDDALVSALSPLARTMVKSGLSAEALMQAAKTAMVQAAIQELTPKGRKPNISRLSVATGLTRKEIAFLLQPKKTAPDAPEKGFMPQRALPVLQGWNVDPLFHRSTDRPADLSMQGESPSFTELVKKYGGDVTPRSVLQELERMKAVTITASGKIRLRRAALAARAHDVQHLAELARHLGIFSTTLSAAFEPKEPRRFFGFKDISVDSLQQAALFQRIFSRRAASLLGSTAQWAAHQMSNKGRQPRDGKLRVGLGIYLTQKD